MYFLVEFSLWIYWKSDNKKIATVDNTGVVTAIEKGNTEIQISSLDGGNVSKTVKINENTMWYIVKDELPLSSIIKEKDLAEYKTYYKYKKISKIII